MDLEHNLRFSLVKKGYSPREVDAVLDELYHQIDSLEQKNKRLNEAINTCNTRIEQLAANTRRIDEERTRESLRLAGILTNAGKTADETMESARRQAADIIAAANADAEAVFKRSIIDSAAVRAQVEKMIEQLEQSRQNAVRCYDELEKVFRGTVGSLHTYTTQSSDKMRPVANTASFAPPTSSEYIDYDEFIRKMGIATDKSITSEDGETKSNLVGRFGE